MVGIGKAFTGLFVSLIAVITAWSLLHVGAEPASTFKTTDLIVSSSSQLQGTTTVQDLIGTQISPAGITGATNNWAPTGLSTASTILVTSSSGQILLNGLTGGTNGRRLTIANIDAAQDLVIRNENVGSTDINRFVTGFGDDVTLRGGNFDSVSLEYQTIAGAGRWHVVSINTFSPPGMAFLGPISTTSTGSFGGAVNMNSHQINNLTDPSLPQDAATKSYVDGHIGSVTNRNPYAGIGADGTCAFDGVATPVCGATLSGSTYTLARTVEASTITIANGVTIKVAGYPINCTGTITGTGTATISARGNDASGATAGARSTVGSTFYAMSTNAGGAGGAAGISQVGGSGTSQGAAINEWPVCTTAHNTNSASRGCGGGGGDGNAVGGAGGDSTPTGVARGGSTIQTLVNGRDVSTNNLFSTGGGGGGGGSSGGTCVGGGGGSGGAWAVVNAGSFAGSLTVTAAGGNGAAATAGTSNCGGGAGGAGGVAIVTYWTASGLTVTAAKGTGGAGVGTGSTGGNGFDGTTFRLNLSGDGT